MIAVLLGVAIGGLVVWVVGERIAREQRAAAELLGYERGYRDGWIDCGKVHRWPTP